MFRGIRFPLNVRRVEGRLRLTLSLTALLALSACDQLPPEFKETQIRSVFNENREAFEELERELGDIEPGIGVMACNTDTTDCFARVEEPSAAQLAAEKRYAPLLRDLGFPGHVFFDQHEGGEFVFPGMGHATLESHSGTYEINLELVLWTQGRPQDAQMCDGYSVEHAGSYYLCTSSLDNNWYIRRRGPNVTLWDNCSDKFPNQYDSPTEDEQRAFYACLGTVPPWERVKAE